MLIRPEDRFIYAIDWPQLSHEIRFVHARGGCEQCGGLHGRIVLHLGDGRWWDADAGCWRNDDGRQLAKQAAAEIAGAICRTRVSFGVSFRRRFYLQAIKPA